MDNMTKEQAAQQAAFSLLLSKLNAAHIELANMAIRISMLEHDNSVLTNQLNVSVAGKPGEPT